MRQAANTSGQAGPPCSRYRAAIAKQTLAITMTTHALARWTVSSRSLLSRAISDAPKPDPKPACPIATPSSTVDQIRSCRTTSASLGSGDPRPGGPQETGIASPDVTIRLGYQVPNFSYSTPVSELFPTVVAQAREAEDAGFDAVFVMDHFYQLPGIGSPNQPMLEAYSALSALATATSRVQLSALVTGNTYRNPSHLAKAVTTLDVVSGGRAVLGIGAGWFELEHRQLGFEFGTFTDRFDRLEEALSIIAPMLRGERPTVDGRWYHTESALNEPRIRDDLPILIGGGGERKTFGLAARYASHLNIICDPAELPRKLSALDDRCTEAGRGRADIDTSFLASVVLGPDREAALAKAEAALRSRGVDLAAIDPQRRAGMESRMFAGSPEEVAAGIKSRILDAGIDGVVVNLIADGHEPGVVTRVGEALAPLVR